mgnify:CR=1 FL=1
MANNHSINILNVQLLKSYSGKQDVVKNITFAIEASDGNVTASVVKNCELDISKLENFVAFENLTESQVKNWIVNSVGNDQIQIYNQEADQKLQNLVSPNEVIVNPPWM